MPKTLLYVHDPLCGYCYGFGSALETVAEARPDLEISVRLGGLCVGERIAPYNTIGEYISQAMPRVAEMTGATYGDAFIKELIFGDTLVSSNPPCAALLQVREAYPDNVLSFAHALQAAHFQDGRDFNDATLYPEVAEKVGLGNMAFKIPEPREVPEALAAEYTATRALNFSGYPSLYLATQSGGDLTDIQPIALDYTPKALLDTLAKAAPVQEAA